MKLQKLFYSMVLLFIFCVSQSAIANDAGASAKTMAKILLHLNHYPSDKEKAQLSGIIDNSKSTHEQVIATAILNMEHSATAADKKQLEKVMEDGNITGPLKDIAGVMLRIHHKASSSDKTLLKAIAN